jgi:hypothetical protein
MGGRLKVLPVSWFYGGAKFMKPVKDVEETLRYLRGLSPLPAEPRSYEPIR